MRCHRGLQLSSEISVHGLSVCVDAAGTRTPRLTVATRGETHAPDRVLSARLGTVDVRGGREITVLAAEEADPADVREALWGTAMAVLLQQRRVLPLHIAAVTVRGRAIGFVGPVAAGKSSLAAAFVDRGHRLVTDDLAALTYDGEGRPAVHPGPPVLHVWGSSARQLGWPTDEDHRLKSGIDKFRYEQPAQSLDRPQRLDAVYVLTERPLPEVSIQPLTGFEKFEVFYSGATYNREYLDTPELRAWHFGEVCRLADQVPTFLVSRPSGDLRLKELASRIEQHLSEQRVA